MHQVVKYVPKLFLCIFSEVANFLLVGHLGVTIQLVQSFPEQPNSRFLLV